MDSIMNNNCQPKKPYTFAILTSQRYDQKLQQSMSCQLTERIKYVANLKEKYMEMNECQCLTLCISNGGQSAKNETHMNKINDSAKMNRSAKNPATAHTLDRQTAQKPNLFS